MQMTLLGWCVVKTELIIICSLIFTTLWVYSADDKLMIFFFIFPENNIWHCIQIVSNGDSLYAMSNPIFWEK